MAAAPTTRTSQPLVTARVRGCRCISGTPRRPAATATSIPTSSTTSTGTASTWRMIGGMQRAALRAPSAKACPTPLRSSSTVDDAVAEYSNNRAAGSADSATPTTPTPTRRPRQQRPQRRRNLRSDDVVSAAAVAGVWPDDGPVLELRHRRHELHPFVPRIRRHARRNPGGDADSG